MKKIPTASLAVFAGVTTGSAALSAAVAMEFAQWTGLHPATVPPVLCFAVLFFFCNILCLKLFLRMFPVVTGPVQEGTASDFRYGVYQIFFLFFLAPINLSRLVPPPLTSLWYRFLGARIGRQSFPSGAILFDPQLISLGDEVTLGANSLLTPHIAAGRHLSLGEIRVGNRVTIGVNTLIYGDTEIGGGALVLAHSTVVPGTRIGENEMWGGNPAKKVKILKPGDRAWNGAPQTDLDWSGEKELEIAGGV